MLKPHEDVQKLIISSPARFVGEYVTEDLLITHAFPTRDKAKMAAGNTENPYGRHYYVVAFETEPLEPHSGGFRILPNYTSIGDYMCVFLSILFGKRFDNHGLFESIGVYHLPSIDNITPIGYPNTSFHNHSPRPDLSIELNLDKAQLIEKIIRMEIEPGLFNQLFAAGEFYLRALQMVEQQTDMAFLNLVACGEVLSNYYQYTDDELYDDRLLRMLKDVEQHMTDGEAMAKELRKRLFQVKRKFVLAVTRSLNNNFFENSETSEAYSRLTKNDIEKRIKATYDLRSLFVHTGIRFGHWIFPAFHGNAEIQIGTPQLPDKDVRQMLEWAPTFIGLERIMRYCLLRFIHLNIIPIDSRLDDDGGSSMVVQDENPVLNS